MDGTAIAPADLVRPWWRRARLWLVLVVVAVLGGVLVGTLSQSPGRLLDPASAHKDGSKALARLLERYGATVHATGSVRAAAGQGVAGAAVVVTAPDDYSTAQLHRLRSAARLVLVRPGTRAAAALASGVQIGTGIPTVRPGCSDPGARAAGKVALPGDAVAYRAPATSCYGGVLITTPRLAVLGSADLLRNDHLAHQGVAALDINAITDSRRITSVVWLLPGADAHGPGPASAWDLFPRWSYRVFWWLVVVGALAAVWRARRLGGVLREPLPVIVRAAEVVEGHGRLYARAGARDRAAGALRAAAVARLGHRLGLPRGAGAEQVGVALAPAVGRPPADVVGILAGAPPADDLELQRLARDLDELESAVGGGTTERTTT
jgi:hypothetical protein